MKELVCCNASSVCVCQSFPYETQQCGAEQCPETTLPPSQGQQLSSSVALFWNYSLDFHSHAYIIDYYFNQSLPCLSCIGFIVGESSLLTWKNRSHIQKEQKETVWIGSQSIDVESMEEFSTVQSLQWWNDSMYPSVVILSLPFLHSL